MTLEITQHAEHWIVGDISIKVRERFDFANDDTKINSRLAQTFITV